MAQSASPSASALPRQLSPLAQRRPSNYDTRESMDGARAVFTDLQCLSTADPLLAKHSKLPLAAHDHQAHSVSKALPLASARKQSGGRKYSNATSRRTSVSSVLSARGGRTSVRFMGGTKDLVGGNNAASERGDASRFSDDGSDESDGEHDVYAITMINKLDSKRAQRQFHENLGTDTYEDGGKVFRGTVDRHGITPAITFTSVETPPSQTKHPLVTSAHTPACGFCSSTNLVWTLRCTFCGSARMSDVPRLKYLIDMVLSVEPYIKPEKAGRECGAWGLRRVAIARLTLRHCPPCVCL